MSFWRYVSVQQGVLDPHWSSTGPLRQLRELGVVLRMHDRAGSCPALRNMRPNLNTTTVRHFSLFAPLVLSRRPPVNLPFANEIERPEHASRVGGYLRACPVNCCALFEQSAGRACGVFSLCTQFILHLVLYAVKQWVRNTHDPLPAETPP
jgi:hypothetical protein